MSELTLITGELYALVEALPHMNHQTPACQLPDNGIYFFFESGETVQRCGTPADRIVRVGTHKKNRRFRARIRQHYGNAASLGGNKNGSVFRKHVGGALLRRDDPGDPRLDDWLTQGGPSFKEVEERVSRELRSNFTFSCFRVEEAEERLALERGLIALLAQKPLGQPTEGWLGKYADDEKIRRTGLWNTQHVDAAPLSLQQLERIGRAAKIV